MPSRRFHSKTRHGCAKCKQRRIKCDTALPKCTNCKKRGLVCAYADLDYTHGASLVPCSLNYHTPAQYGVPASPPNVHSAFTQIMHHFSTGVSLSVSNEPSIQHLWQSSFPSEAMSQSYLWHGILSVSMLHLLYVNQGSPIEIKSIALRHHSMALSCLRKCLSSPIMDNCGAIFALSMCVGLFTIGLGQAFPSESIDPINEIIDIFSLIRGVQFVTNTGSEWLQASSFRIMTQLEDTETDSMPLEMKQAMEALEACNAASLDDSNTKMDYELAMQTLERRFRTADIAYYKNPGFILVWANVLPPGFMDLLRQKTSLALVIMGHFCVLLHRVKDYWWIGDRGSQLLRAIEEQLSPKWNQLLVWPKFVVGQATPPIGTSKQ